MLKIKDNVDLKELEKYGFKRSDFDKYEKLYEFDDYKIDIYIDLWDRTRTLNIQNDNYDCDFTCLIPNVIYNLIKDGLVEKVEE